MNIPFEPPYRSVADLLRSLGDVPAERVRFSPVPGSGTVDDLLKPGNRGCELVDGVLVEKPVGVRESLLAMWLGKLLLDFVVPRNLGMVTGEQGLLELSPGVVRGPDVAFISWDRTADRHPPEAPIPQLVADLAVEVLSPSNTPAEMARKRDEYFRAGVRLVWEVDPRARMVRAYTAADRFEDFAAGQTLTGGDVLPGFTLPLADLFGQLDRHG